MAESMTVTVSEARAALPALVDRVLAGEEITLTRHGRPVAVVVRPDALRSRRGDEVFATAGKVRAILEGARAVPLRSDPVLRPDRAEQLLAEVRAGRARR